MALSIGIVGLPNVGKSTLFTAMTNKGGLAANSYRASEEMPERLRKALPDIDELKKLL